MIRRYRLPVRDALSLRLPHPAVWPLVLVGSPAALVTGIGVGQLAQKVFPVPQRIMESFGEFLAPQSVPLWELVLLVAVLPGICEEIAFRGVLLYGLRSRLRPVPLALAVGTIFGLFHVSLFRIVPTAWLGVLLATVVLLTGSIFPAMLWHAVNNAAALVPERLGWIDPEMSIPGWAYPVAAGVLALVLAGLWAVRRPLPGVKGWTARKRVAPGTEGRTEPTGAQRPPERSGPEGPG